MKYVANTGTGCKSNRVPFTPSHELTAEAKGNVRVGNTNLRPQVAVRRIGPLCFDSTSTLKQEGYTVLDVSEVWKVSDNVELATYIHNLTDRKYRTYGFFIWCTRQLCESGPWASVWFDCYVDVLENMWWFIEC